MFKNATAFNRDLKSWDTSRVTNMMSMFQGASAIDRIIADWNVSAVTNMAGMFDGATGLSDLKKGINHESFSSNSNWPYDWR